MKTVEMPKFANENEEALWWASAEGRGFLKEQSTERPRKVSGGSKLVANLGKTASVQIALRLPTPDLAKAKEIAERKGIGYQTLLKMIVHEGLEREGRRP
ncbi:MAG: CopG family antitoxin [Acidobacteria bacterium]|nr:CopG family antitoxin [Acidobacteriota bacterium]